MAKKKSPALRSVGDALTSPQTRQERYLANIAGLVATKPEYPFTRLERYLDAIAQSTGGSAEAIEELKQNKLNVYGGGVNLLDNWYFIGGGSQQGGGQFPINQREQTNYSGAATHFDRWKSVDSAAVTSIEPDGITVAPSVFQEIENIDSLLGKTLTLSALSADGLAAVTVIMPSTYPSTAASPHADNGSTRITLRYIVGSVRVYLGRIPGATSSVKYYAAKLELGDTQTLAHQDAGGNWVLNDPPPNFQQELAKCQRYQVHIPMYSRYPVAYSPSENAFDFVIPVPVTMRSLPSIDYGSFEIRQNSSAASDFAFSCVLNQNGSILIRAVKANHGLIGFVTLYCVNNAMLSANL